MRPARAALLNEHEQARQLEQALLLAEELQRSKDKMAEFQGKRVSRTWKRVLSQAVRDGLKFKLNSGRRTMREQWALWRAYKNGTGNLAAFPNPNAPHIWAGRPNHAIDVDQYAGDGEQALQDWLHKHGVPAVNNVAGEGWHLFAPAFQLLRFAHRIRRRQRRR